MIEELTKEQEAKIPEYVEKYTKIGLSTDRIDRKKITENVNVFYEKILDREKPKKTLFFESPRSAWLAICVMKYAEKFVKHEIENMTIGQTVFDDNGNFEITEDMLAYLGKDAWHEIFNIVSPEIERMLVDNGSNKNFVEVIKHQAIINFKGKVYLEYVEPYIEGAFESYIFAYYDYFHNELDIEYEVMDLYKIWKKTLGHDRMWCFDDYCIISEKPILIKINNEKLHCEDGPAIEYADGFSLYSLNGVRVPEKIVMLSADEITADMILKEQNVEIRREIVRKIGTSRLVEITKSEMIDEDSIEIDGRLEDYELYKVPLGNDRFGRALKMKNPSLKDVYHFEYVANDCETVRDAVVFRNQTKKMPRKLT